MNLQSVPADGHVHFEQLTFGFFSKPVVVVASNAALSSDAGLLPIRQFDEKIGMTRRLADALVDCRQAGWRHGVIAMLRSRVFGIMAGYEDQNDHDSLRHDPIFKIISDRSPDDAPLASQPTLSRFENNVSVRDLKRLREATVQQWVDSFAAPPARITLDVDAVDDPAHGAQQLIMFHGYYEQWQYLPLLISHAESEQFVAISLRPGAVHAALGAEDDVEFVVTVIRQRFPDVEIIIRGDCAFGIPAMYEVCERLNLTYTFGISSNPKLQKMTDELLEKAKRQYEETGRPQRLFEGFAYRAGGWPHDRYVIAKAECHGVGTNRRFIVTNRPGAALYPEPTYDEHVMRGEAENRNKEIKTGLAMDRMSDHRFMANFFRLYLHTAAHNLTVRLRQAIRLPEHPSPVAGVAAEALTGQLRKKHQAGYRRRDSLGKGQPCTWRTQLIKVAAEVIVSARRIVIRLAANWPFLDVYQRIGRFTLPSS